MGGIYTEKKKSFIISALYYLTIGATLYVLLKYAVFIVLPFIIGFVIAAVLSPIVRFLGHKFSMKRKPTSILILLIFYGTIGILLALSVVKLTVLIGDFSGRLPTIYSENIEPFIAGIFEWVNDIVSRIDGQGTSEFSEDLGGLFESVKASLGTTVSDISVRVLSKISSFAAAVPGFIIELFFAVISSFFFIIDYENILGILKSRLPEKAVGVMSDMRDKFLTIIIKYLRSYALIMLITFAELFFGLSVIGTKNAAVYAFLISLLDVLPAVGTGVVMVPWAVIDLLRGGTVHGIGLLVLWAAITVIRNIIEPRIVGRQVGLHPLVTLIAMFVGTKLFGFFGLLFLPIGLSIAVSVIRERAQSSDSV
ncbi:MAG: sporulation integral membrane protein YtvI [Clostridia bacterium]|nr:sporulation integral membrane protein YtvI [Clostridia bacterium]